MGIFVQIALRNLVQARRRTLLLGFALGAVTALLVLLLSLSQGITDTMIHAATTLSSGHINVAGFFKAKPTDGAPIVTGRKKLRAIVEKKTPDLAYVVERARGWGRLISQRASLNTGLTGLDLEEEGRFLETIRLAEEREYKEGGRAEVLGELRRIGEDAACLLFVAQAKRLEVGVGDTITFTVETMAGARNTADFTVVAIAKDVGFMSNWNVFVSNDSIRSLYGMDQDVTGAIHVYLDDYKKSSRVMGELRDLLAKEGYALMEHDPQPFWMKFDAVSGEDWTGQKLDLTIWSDEVSFLMWVLTAVDSVSFLLIGILIVIIAIGIMNSMWISVRERTTEVGTLRAVGMSRSRVLLMFLLEALLLGVASTVMGAVIGALAAVGLDAAEIPVPIEAVQAILMSETLQLSVRPMQLVGAVLVFTVISGLSALWPAFRASRLQPVTAIQHVG